MTTPTNVHSPATETAVIIPYTEAPRTVGIEANAEAIQSETRHDFAQMCRNCGRPTKSVTDEYCGKRDCERVAAFAQSAPAAITTQKGGTNKKTIPFFTSFLRSDVNDIERLLKVEESIAHDEFAISSDRSAELHSIQEKIDTVLKKVNRHAKNLDDDDGFFARLGHLHLHIVQVGIALRIKWAVYAVKAAVEGSGMNIATATDAYERAATTVQGLNDEQSAIYEPIIAGLKTKLAQIRATSSIH